MNAILLSAFALRLATGGPEPGQLERVDPDVEVPSVSVDELARAEKEKTPAPRVIDVRLEEDFDADPVLLPNASWRDPNANEAWAREITKEEEVVVYCVRGALGQSVRHEEAPRYGVERFPTHGRDRGL